MKEENSSMGNPVSLEEIAQEIAEEVRKLDAVEQEEEIQRIADAIMGPYRLNSREKRVVHEFVKDMLEDCETEPSDK